MAKTTSKKTLSTLLVVVLVAVVAIGGMLAYLTDRDSEVNVFTVGNVEIDLTEDFEQGATLTPGVDITKKPTITNTGKNDAWVWMTFSVPSALDNYVQGTDQGSNENTIHWNPLGATAEGYVTDARVEKAIADGNLPAGTTAADILETNKTWNVFNSLGTGQNVYQEEINGVQYNTYVLLYNKALEPGETTLTSIYNVFLDAHVDIDPEGNWYRVENGNAVALDWNSTTDGNPVIYVSAYAIQKEEFATVAEAYAAYQTQWGDNGKEYGDAFENTLKYGENVSLKQDVTADVVEVEAGADVEISLNDNTLSGIINNNGNMTVSNGNIDSKYIENHGNATFTDVEMKAGDAANYANINSAGSETVYNDVELTAGGGGIGAVGGSKVTFNSGKVAIEGTTTNPRYVFYVVGNGTELTINGGDFSFVKPTLKRAYIYAGSGATVYVNGGNFGEASTREGYTAGILCDGTVVIKGGTFGFDPSKWVAEGYQAVKGENGVWTVSAK